MFIGVNDRSTAALNFVLYALRLRLLQRQHDSNLLPRSILFCCLGLDFEPVFNKLELNYRNKIYGITYVCLMAGKF